MAKKKLKTGTATGEPPKKKKMSSSILSKNSPSPALSTSQDDSQPCTNCDEDPKNSYKCFNDPIHKHMELHPLLVKFINTPQFQRLKNIKQLGGNYFLYPAASHNRFEHSIGTCHLAGELVRHLQSNQSDLDITEEDVLCVELAGLCHDLGHGPFSHMFDHIFLGEVERKKGLKLKKKKKKTWNHEKRSCLMFDQILKDNTDVAKMFEDLLKERGDDRTLKKIKESGDEDENKFYFTKFRNAIFIKEMINGPISDDMVAKHDPQDTTMECILKFLRFKNKSGKPVLKPQAVEPNKFVGEGEWKYTGRPRSKGFFYEIVANKRNGVDVDKWDYFARDCHQLGITNSFDHVRFMKNMRVLDVKEKESSPEEYAICARDKECKNLYEMFHTRDSLHRRAYQHKISTAVEAMICDAMVLANGCIKLKGSGGEEDEKTMARSVDDMVAFEKLTDNVMQQIYYSNDSSDAMKEARHILKRVLTDDYYFYMGVKNDPEDKFPVKIGETYESLDEVQKRIEDWKVEQEKNFWEKFKGLEKHVVCRVKKYHYGKEAQNPVDLFWFYSKDKPDTPIRMNREDVSHLLPKQFLEYELEVYFKGKVFEDRQMSDKTETFKKVKVQFDSWMNQQ